MMVNDPGASIATANPRHSGRESLIQIEEADHAQRWHSVGKKSMGFQTWRQLMFLLQENYRRIGGVVQFQSSFLLFQRYG